jgi:hypothetical protein
VNNLNLFLDIGNTGELGQNASYFVGAGRFVLERRTKRNDRRSLKTVEAVLSRRVNEFDQVIRFWRLRKLEKSRKSLEKRSEDGRTRPGDGPTEDQLFPNENKYHRTEANIHSIESRTGKEAGGFGGLEGRRSQKGPLRGGTVGPHLLGRIQKKENGKEM